MSIIVKQDCILYIGKGTADMAVLYARVSGHYLPMAQETTYVVQCFKHGIGGVTLHVLTADPMDIINAVEGGTFL